MNERKTKGLTNLNSDEKIIRDTCVSLARMYFSQFAAISCYLFYEVTTENNRLIYQYISFSFITKYQGLVLLTDISLTSIGIYPCRNLG